MRALLNPVIIKEFGLVAFRPGPELLPHFCRGRILLENEPDRLADLPTGEIAEWTGNPLLPVLKDYFHMERSYVLNVMTMKGL